MNNPIFDMEIFQIWKFSKIKDRSVWFRRQFVINFLNLTKIHFFKLEFFVSVFFDL